MSKDTEENNKELDFKKTIEKATEFQQDMLRQFSTIQFTAFQNMFSSLQGFTNYNAMFKTNVQTGGRISIPEAERQALGIEEGDLVQVIIIPLSRKKKSNSNSTTNNSVSTNNTNTFKG
ncbi:MAG TPA: AbrB/MazE/SpoVT family DNA-binding domain-containing protein [Candidatus Nitrosocosmicus sp.]